MSLKELNHLEKFFFEAVLYDCCGSANWAEKMEEQRPFEDIETLYTIAKKIWFEDCKEADWLEAFTQHPKIGDIKSLEKKFASTKEWSSQEQAGVNEASMEVLKALAAGNEAYEQKFGYIFIVCATGKTAAEMLDLLNERLPNEPGKEIHIAMGEQHKITEIRLEKLLSK